MSADYKYSRTDWHEFLQRSPAVGTENTCQEHRGDTVESVHDRGYSVIISADSFLCVIFKIQLQFFFCLKRWI